jgi:hypothetical protein
VFQLSNGLKLGVNTRINRITEALEQASCDLTTNTRRTISTVLIGSLVTCSAVNILPSNANAAEASQLYANAEKAIALNLKDYAGLDKDWSTAKGILKENANLLTKSGNALSSINAKMVEFDASFTKILEDDVVAISEVNTEITGLRESSGSKYNLAVLSAAKPDRPTVTAQLFMKAQNEASTLAQDEKILKSFSETVGIDSSLKKRADEILNSITGIVGKSTDIQAIQAAGLADMLDGLSTNAAACKDSLNQCSESGDGGLVKFRAGVVTVDGASEKFDKLKKDIFTQLKTLQSMEVDLIKSTAKLNAILTEDQLWEEDNKLQLNNGKKSVKLIAQKYEKILKDTSAMIGKLGSTNDMLSNKDSNNRKEVSDSLKIVSKRLDNADKTGIDAEKLLRLAKAQGDKEAAKYLNFIPSIPAPVTPVVTASKGAGKSGIYLYFCIYV